MSREQRRYNSSERSSGFGGSPRPPRGTPGKRTLSESLPIQRKAGPSPADQTPSSGDTCGGLPAGLRERMDSAFNFDFSGVHVHEGGAAPAMGAVAYTQGNDLHFAPGAYDPSTTGGQELIAHELAHVVQQSEGRVTASRQAKGLGINEDDRLEREADTWGARAARGEPIDRFPGGGGHANVASGRAVQMRRMPTNVGELLTAPADRSMQGANHDAHLAGVMMLCARAKAQLSSDENAQAWREANGSQRSASSDSPSQSEQSEQSEVMTRWVEVVSRMRPDLVLGDPALINTTPGAGSVDAENLAQIILRASGILSEIVGGDHDVGLAEVFGVANVAAARGKYANAQAAMVMLHRENKVVTDRTGYMVEVGAGGSSKFQATIVLDAKYLDNPGDPEATITMIHEALHAGNQDVTDRGYIEQPSFTVLPEDVKLTNAAHFEVVPRRILGTECSFLDTTFEPAGSNVDSSTRSSAAPPMTLVEEAIRNASETLRKAWSSSLRFHLIYCRLYRNPREWARPLYHLSLPYWSKVGKLTIHQKSFIDPTSEDPAKHPVSQIGIALSEGYTRKLYIAMSMLPKTEADVRRLTARTSASMQDRLDASSAFLEHFLIWSVLDYPSVKLTGSVERDNRAVQELAALPRDVKSALTPRDPKDFPFD